MLISEILKRCDAENLRDTTNRVKAERKLGHSDYNIFKKYRRMLPREVVLKAMSK